MNILIVAGNGHSEEFIFDRCDNAVKNTDKSQARIISASETANIKVVMKWAATRNIELDAVTSWPEMYDQMAAFRLNYEIAHRAEAAIVFWDGHDPTIDNLVGMLILRGFPIKEYLKSPGE